MGRKDKIQYLLVFAVESLSLIISAGAMWLVLNNGLHLVPEFAHSDILRFFLLLAASFLAGFFVFNCTAAIPQKEWKGRLLLCAENNIIIGAVLAVALIVGKNPLIDSRYLYVGILACNLALEFLLQTLLKHYLVTTFYKGTWATNTGIITTQERAAGFIHSLKGDWSKKLQGVVVLDAQPGDIGVPIDGVPIIAVFEDFMEVIRHAALDEVYINIPYQTGASLQPYVQELESMGLAVHINVPSLECYVRPSRPGTYTPELRRTLEEIGGVPVVTVAGSALSFHDLILKRLMDIVGAIVGLIISIPIIAVVAVPLKLESRGPLFFKQKRVGRNGRIFYIYKLRSMYKDAEQRKQELMDKNKMQGLMFKVEDDPRITKVGKFIRRTSIDELPQFWNVLRGDMSLVGTRPPTLDEYERYESHHKRRLSMKPGITGLWQVSGRSDIENFEDVVMLDVQYIDNWSLKEDIKILLKTIAVVFERRGAE